jgi:hypothetical protein
MTISWNTATPCGESARRLMRSEMGSLVERCRRSRRIRSGRSSSSPNAPAPTSFERAEETRCAENPLAAAVGGIFSELLQTWRRVGDETMNAASRMRANRPCGRPTRSGFRCRLRRRWRLGHDPHLPTRDVSAGRPDQETKTHDATMTMSASLTPPSRCGDLSASPEDRAAPLRPLCSS